MLKFMPVFLFGTALAFAGTKSETSVIVKQDTILTVKQDTTKSVKTDSIKIVKTYRDTSILIKVDTIKTSSVSKAIAKPVAPKGR